MQTVNFGTVKENVVFTDDLLLDPHFVILPHSTPVSSKLIQTLKNWGFSTFLTNGDVSLEGTVESATGKETGIHDAVKKQKRNGKEPLGKAVKDALEESKKVKIGNSDSARMKMVKKVYDEYMDYIENVFTHYATHKEIDKEDLSEAVKDLCVFTKDNRRYMLRINPVSSDKERNFLIIHAMRTTVLAIALALQIHMPLSKMIELGETCIIHEIGMLHLPPQLYMADRRLSPGERAQISKHTILGYQIVKDLDFSLAVQLGVLEHHERENGTGYPQKKAGEKISTNAKIIALACSYEAITAKRSFRTGRTKFDAIVELLHNKEHGYDDKIIRAMLDTVSIYPIGSYVYLSDRKIAQVIDTNPGTPKNPIVKYITEKEADGSDKIISTSSDRGITIQRVLSDKEEADIIKFVEEKEAEEALVQQETFTEPPHIKAEEKSDSEPKEKIEIQSQKTQAQKEDTEPLIQTEGSGGMEDIDISIFS